MPPVQPMDDQPDPRRSQTVPTGHPGDLCTGRVRVADDVHVGLGEPRHGVSAPVGMVTRPGTVGAVLAGCPSVEMRRVTAASGEVIAPHIPRLATVADEAPARIERAAAQQERQPVGAELSIGLAAADAEVAVTVGVQGTDPRPTRVGASSAINLTPEASEVGCAKIREHLKPPTWGATPPAGRTARGHSYTQMVPGVRVPPRGGGG